MVTERKPLYADGNYRWYGSAELRHMIVRRNYSSQEEYKRIMAEITRRERSGIDDISNMNAVPRARP
ncbi:hypothetical protein OIU34_20640 [Pararhizobium sp. BT-229]|uniref:hypothetical protein n=1 Tax=Pararhizobium sp. BT-229 TaxID=2986923 RepID=UPI0021F7F6B1|nr:hypothetical protein [Pararhizobium sp. BT-229]MCV9964298.1 hypothetical protein [Pararhizobium sp. BT-229]